jgi:hypothetical protein
MAHKPKDAGQEHLDDLLDAALAGTFPASDPVAHLVSETKERSAAPQGQKAAPPAERGQAGHPRTTKE